MGWGPVPLPGEKLKEVHALHDAAKFIDGLEPQRKLLTVAEQPEKISADEREAAKNFWRDPDGTQHIL